MLVSDLSIENESQLERKYTKNLSDVRLSEDGNLFFRDDENRIPFDEVALDLMGKHLKINTAYLSKCPPPLQRDNVNYWLNHHGDSEATFYTVGGTLRGIFNPSKKIFPVNRVVEVIGRIFNPEDEVKAFNTTEELVNIDVISLQNSVEVPGLGTEERPKVGDITHGGLRMFIYPFQEKAPEIESYFNRLWCTNGSSSPHTEHKITLRGHTVEEVIAEIEDKARILMDELPEKLQQYKETANIAVPTKVGEFVYQVGQEAGLPARIMNRVMGSLATLPDNPMVYDVMQLFTAVANESVSWPNRLRLQRIGGDFALNTHKVLHRCGQCERPI
jgi:hypothetical protein